MSPTVQSPAVIAIQVGDARQLINSLDPSPFRTRDLDRDAEEHIVGWARELPLGAPIDILIHMPRAGAEQTIPDELAAIIAGHFSNSAAACERELRELLRVGRVQLAIGILVLSLCLAFSQFLSGRFGDGSTMQFVLQGLLILGWVANWKPLETFLYDWWPIIRRRRLFLRLAQAKVSLVVS